jgi:hypothetical protein
VAITKTRNKAVLFRVTEDEYNRLIDACSSGGARSLSDFARGRLLGPGAASAEPPLAQAPSLAHVEEKLNELKSALDRLAHRFEKTTAETVTQGK